MPFHLQTIRISPFYVYELQNYGNKLTLTIIIYLLTQTKHVNILNSCKNKNENVRQSVTKA